MNEKTNCPTCGHLREVAGTTTKYFVPPVNEETKHGLSAEEMSKILYPYPDLTVFNNDFEKEKIMYRENRCRQAFILGYKKAIEQTTALQQENQRLREANEWVSVEDRLPSDEESTEYLCYDSYHRQKRVLVFNPHHQCWDQEDGDDYYTDLIGGKVSHWMPLPTNPTTKNK